MQKFVHEQNLTHYLMLLETESDPPRREILRRLLVEEEDQYGSLLERLDRAERAIARGEARLTEQRDRIGRLDGDGHDTGLAATILANMGDSLDLMIHYRQNLLDQTGEVDL